MNNSLHALAPSKLPCKCSYYSLYASAADYIANGVGFYLGINIKKTSVNVNHESTILHWMGTITEEIILIDLNGAQGYYIMAVNL